MGILFNEGPNTFVDAVSDAYQLLWQLRQCRKELDLRRIQPKDICCFAIAK
jgi:hypothetical protein